jgi:formyl-CoA transferase
MQDAVANLMRVSLRDHQRAGESMPRKGNQLGNIGPGSTFPCHPGGPNDYVYLYVQPQMWQAFVDVVDNDALRTNPKFATVESRWEHREELTKVVSEWTMQHTKYDVMERLGAVGVPCGACQDTAEVLADPHLRAREMIQDVNYPTRGVYQTVGCPIKLSASPARTDRPPLLGEHTDQLLTDLCGTTPEELEALRQQGVI